jgi:hypothetical protein
MNPNKRLMAGIAGLFIVLSGVTLLAQGGGQDRNRKQYNIEVIPALAELEIGETLQFNAQAVDRSGSAAEVEIEWSVLNQRIGEIDENGLFTAISPGHTIVVARAERSVGRAEVIVRCESPCVPDPDRFKVFIRPRSATLEVGEMQQFSATLVDPNGEELPAEFEWGVDGDFAAIDRTGLLEAIEPGRGFIYATTRGISGRAHVVVKRDIQNGAGPGVRKRGTKMLIFPRDTLVLVGNVIEYEAFLVDTLGNRTEVYPEWEIAGREVGFIDESGLFTAETAGNGVIKATLEHYTATARARVATTEDPANANQVEFKMRRRDGGQVGQLQRIAETDVLRISGLPFPLNLLNGAEISLPAGSLAENISIDVTIPSLADIRDDSTVSLPEAVLSGIAFHVYVDGKLVSPYVFDEPVQVVIPYKQNLMEDMGLTLDDLWVFFYSDTAGYNADGLYNIIIDTTEHKIIVEASHFSELVIADKKLSAITSVASSNSLSEYNLFGNYPNPFNPETTIRFSVGGRQIRQLSVRIYNLLGQEIRMLAEREFFPGYHELKWDGRDYMGHPAGTGVYLYRLEGEHINLTGRMVLLR